MNYLGSAEIYADMPKVLRQFMVFSGVWTGIAFIATLFSMVNSPSLLQISWFPVALLLLGSGMLASAVKRYFLFRQQFSLQITRNTLLDDGCLEGYVAIKNVAWQWKSGSRLYLKFKTPNDPKGERLINVDSRLRPKGQHIHIDFSTIIDKPLPESGFGKLYVEFMYNDDLFKESFVLKEKPE
jgi:hypothetical protein